MLVGLLEHLFGETALLGCEVQQLAVVELASELLGEHLGYL